MQAKFCHLFLQLLSFLKKKQNDFLLIIKNDFLEQGVVGHFVRTLTNVDTLSSISFTFALVHQITEKEHCAGGKSIRLVIYKIYWSNSQMNNYGSQRSPEKISSQEFGGQGFPPRNELHFFVQCGAVSVNIGRCTHSQLPNKMIFLLYTGTSALIIYISNIQ